MDEHDKRIAELEKAVIRFFVMLAVIGLIAIVWRVLK
jgi:hypothetical protein